MVLVVNKLEIKIHYYISDCRNVKIGKSRYTIQDKSRLGKYWSIILFKKLLNCFTVTKVNNHTILSILLHRIIGFFLKKDTTLV